MAERVSSEHMMVAKRVVNSISGALASVGMWLIVVMTLLVLADITLRAVGRPFLGTLDITELLLSICAFLAMAETWRVDRHVRVQLFLIRFSTKSQTWLEMLASVLGASLFSLIAWRNVLMGIARYEMNTITWQLEIPVYPVHIIIALAAIMLVTQMLFTFASNINKLVTMEKR